MDEGPPPIPRHILENANKHAGGAIVEIDRQIQTSRRVEKIARLIRKRQMWQSVFERTTELLRQPNENPPKETS